MEQAGDLKRAIAGVLAEAEQAVDPHKNGLMDYGDLQRVVRRLSDTLQLAERAYADLRAKYEELADSLTRAAPHDMPMSEHARQPSTYHA